MRFAVISVLAGCLLLVAGCQSKEPEAKPLSALDAFKVKVTAVTEFEKTEVLPCATPNEHTSSEVRKLIESGRDHFKIGRAHV